MKTNPEGYLVTMDGWYARLIFAIVFATIVAFVIPLLMPIFGPFWGFVIGISIWIVTLTQAAEFFFVAVPEVTGLITIMQLFKRPTIEDEFANYRVFPTGLHPRFPWERVTTYIDLRQIPVLFKEDIPAKDGVLVTFRGSNFYLPLIKWLPVYIAVSKATIETAIKDVTTSYLTSKMRDIETAEEARAQAHGIEEGLKTHLELTKEEQSYEKRFAIDVVLSQIADVNFNDAYTKAVNDRAIAKTLQQVADELIKRGISPKEAMNFALINAGKIKKDITELEGLRDVAEIVAKAVIEGLRYFGQQRNPAA